MMTVNASMPAILNGFGVGGSGAGFGHDASQSVQEQAVVFDYKE